MILAIRPSPTDKDLPIVKILETVDPESNNLLETSAAVSSEEEGDFFAIECEAKVSKNQFLRTQMPVISSVFPGHSIQLKLSSPYPVLQDKHFVVISQVSHFSGHTTN